MNFQQLVCKIFIVDNVLEYVVNLVIKICLGIECVIVDVNNYISWGVGLWVLQYLVLGVKCYVVISGKYFLDKEDVQVVVNYVLCYCIVCNYKVEVEGVIEEDVILQLL